MEIPENDVTEALRDMGWSSPREVSLALFGRSASDSDAVAAIRVLDAMVDRKQLRRSVIDLEFTDSPEPPMHITVYNIAS